MSTQRAYPRPRPLAVDTDLLRDIAALLLILAGLTALVVIAFLLDPLAGAAAVSALSIAAGAILGLRR